MPTARTSEPAHAQAASNPSLSELKILLAEDNPVNQKLALLVLRRLGIQPDVAANGTEAVALACRNSYDVVLMDVQMPEMDGIEATRCIRSQRPPFAQPFIVALTAGVTEPERQAAVAAGMNEFLGKPFVPAQLTAVLQTVRPTKGKAVDTA